MKWKHLCNSILDPVLCNILFQWKTVGGADIVLFLRDEKVCITLLSIGKSVTSNLDHVRILSQSYNGSDVSGWLSQFYLSRWETETKPPEVTLLKVFGHIWLPISAVSYHSLE